MNNVRWPQLAVALLLPQCAGALGGLAAGSSVSTWYQTLIKPPLTPPGWVFGPVWTFLYFLMGWAFYLVLVSPSDHHRRATAVLLFYVHLAVNASWSFLFFGLRDPLAALVDIMVLWIMIAALVPVFRKINPVAGAMLLPYWLWVSFAVYLNYGIWKMN